MSSNKAARPKRRAQTGVFTSRARTRAALLAGVAILGPVLASANTQEPAVADPTRNAITRADNPTGRAFDLALPLTIYDRLLGEVIGNVSVAGDITVSVEDLVRLLEQALSDESIETLRETGDANGRATLEDLRREGFDIRYDPSRLEIALIPSADQARGGAISLGRAGLVGPDGVEAPAKVAAYLNFRNSVDMSNLTADGDVERGRFRSGIDGATRLFGAFVVEGEASYQEEDGFSREGTRLVYDHLPSATRWQAGDVDVMSTGFQGGEQLLGLNVERRYGDLSDRQSVAPSGRGRFRIERPSQVDVVVNGRSVRRLTLQPGVYDIEDLNLSQGTNDVQLIVEDLDGRVEVLEFTLFFDRSLLATDAQEFAVAAGVRASQDGVDIAYESEEPVASAYYRTGVTDELTLGVNAQSDTDVGQAGLEGVTAFPVGAVAFDAAVSNEWEEAGGIGVGLNLDYSVGDFSLWPEDQNQRSFDLSLEYLSQDFVRVGDLSGSDFWLLANASYSQSVGEAATVGLSGGYSVGRDGVDDRYNTTLTASFNVMRDLSASASIGYEATADVGSTDSSDSEVFGAMNLSYRFGGGARASASYDTQDNLTRVGYSDGYGSGIGALAWDAEVERSDDEAGVSGSVDYTANRALLRLSHDTGLSENGTDVLSDRTTARVDTALVFADGRFAVSRPVSDSFAIIEAHPSLEDRKVLVEPEADSPSAKSDFLGPAVIPDLSSYSIRQIPYDVEDLPLGYDLGAGAFALSPAYRSGYRLRVGSDYSVTVIGTLRDAAGEPLPLVSGVARYEVDEDRPTVTVFTNRAGRFVAQGLRAGLWIVYIDGETYEIDVPDDAAGLIQIGDMTPLER